MKHLSITSALGRSVLAAALLALVAGPASAATYTLRAGATTVNYGNGPVTAWGYALDSTDVPGMIADGVIRVPGPTVYVPAGEDLTINLVNELNEPTSIVVHGQKRVGTPVFDGGRVRAFTQEAAPMAAAPANVWSYSWSAADLRPGTFLYNSGNHPAKQVHMGLYGAVVIDADSDGDPATLEAYPGLFYDQDIVVIYSEVDPDLRNTESAAKALNFKPKYFLVNGDHSGNSVLTAAPADLNSRMLLRIVNAGLKAYVPTMLGEDLEWVAEDGNRYPYSKKSYSAYLGAGKTMDALWVPVTTDRHTLYDRRLHTSANGEAGGGIRAFLDSAMSNVPLANAGTDSLHVALGTPITLTGSAINGSGTYSSWDWSLVAFPAGNTAALVVDPIDPNIVTITPDAAGTYTAQLVVTDDAGMSSGPATVNVFTNLAPVANAGQDQLVDLNTSFHIDGTASYDPDPTDTITYAWRANHPVFGWTPLAGIAENDIFASAVGLWEFELTVSDGELEGIDTMYVTVSESVNQPPDAVDDYFQVIRMRRSDTTYQPNALYVLVNDSDPNGTIDGSTMSIVTEPMRRAVAAVVFDGSQWIIEYTPKPGFKGTDYMTYSVCDNGGACSEAQVFINVVKD